jgi:excisionase family DNA binding protein
MRTTVVAVPADLPVIDPTEILTLDELALRLKVSRRWVYEKSRHRCQNPLPAFRPGRVLRFYWPDVSDWLRKTAQKEAA